jgi:mannose-6-phosphate isomerase-like protein (cupin superfamily)
MKFALFVLSVAALTIPALAQSGGKAELFSAAQIREQVTALSLQAAASGSAGQILADYGSHKVQVSVRTSSGGAEVHAHFDDVMIVQQGSATLITGGTVIDPKSTPDGETKGTGIQGGKSQTILPGDLVTVNAGVPHQIMVSPGTTYSAVVIKVRE